MAAQNFGITQHSPNTTISCTYSESTVARFNVTFQTLSEAGRNAPVPLEYVGTGQFTDDEFLALTRQYADADLAKTLHIKEGSIRDRRKKAIAHQSERLNVSKEDLEAQVESARAAKSLPPVRKCFKGDRPDEKRTRGAMVIQEKSREEEPEPEPEPEVYKFGDFYIADVDFLGLYLHNSDTNLEKEYDLPPHALLKRRQRTIERESERRGMAVEDVAKQTDDARAATGAIIIRRAAINSRTRQSIRARREAQDATAGNTVDSDMAGNPNFEANLPELMGDSPDLVKDDMADSDYWEGLVQGVWGPYQAPVSRLLNPAVDEMEIG